MKNKTNLLVDLGIFLAFLAAMEPKMTGEPIHEWLSIALAGTVIVHLLLHWDWIITIGRKYFAKLWHSSRLNFFLDILLFIAFNALMISGFMVSKTILPLIGIEVEMRGMWKIVHKMAADISMWVIAAHVGLHWRWIWMMFKKTVLTPISRLGRKQPELAVVKIETEIK